MSVPDPPIYCRVMGKLGVCEAKIQASVVGALGRRVGGKKRGEFQNVSVNLAYQCSTVLSQRH